MDEKIITIPLGKAFNAPRRYRRKRAVEIVRETVKRTSHADSVSIAPGVSEMIWEKSKPPRRIRIMLKKDGNKAFVGTVSEKKEKPEPGTAK